MADSGWIPPTGSADHPPLFPLSPRKAGARRRGGHPALWVALYVIVSLIWLLAGDPLVAAWLGTALGLPAPHWLTHALFVTASGAFFYGLLDFHARTVQRAARTPDIRLVEAIEQITDAVFVKDRQGRYLMLNSTGARQIGRVGQRAAIETIV